MIFQQFYVHNTFQPNAEQATSVGGGSPPALRTVQQRLITSGKIEYFNSPDHDTTLTNVAAKKGVGLGEFPALHDGPEDPEGIGRGMSDLRIHCLCLAA